MSFFFLRFFVLLKINGNKKRKKRKKEKEKLREEDLYRGEAERKAVVSSDF